MSIADLTGALQGLAMQCGSTTTALQEMAKATEETTDPFAELTKTLDSFYAGKDKWGDAFRQILQNLKDQKIGANEAREAIQQLIVALSQSHDVDAFSGGAKNIQDMLQQLEKLLAALDRAKRRP